MPEQERLSDNLFSIAQKFEVIGKYIPVPEWVEEWAIQDSTNFVTTERKNIWQLLRESEEQETALNSTGRALIDFCQNISRTFQKGQSLQGVFPSRAGLDGVLAPMYDFFSLQGNLDTIEQTFGQISADKPESQLWGLRKEYNPGIGEVSSVTRTDALASFFPITEEKNYLFYFHDITRGTQLEDRVWTISQISNNPEDPFVTNARFIYRPDGGYDAFIRTTTKEDVEQSTTYHIGSNGEILGEN